MLLSFRRNIAWMAISQAGMFALQFGSSLIVARLLTPYDMGVFAVAIAITSILSIVRSIGLASYLVRAVSLDEAMLRSVFTVNAAISLVVFSAVVGFGLAGGSFLREPGVRHVLLVLSLVPLLGIVELLPAAGIERSGNFRLIGSINVARNLVGVIVLLAFAFTGHSYMSLAYGQVAAAALGALMFSVVGRRYVRFRLGTENWREITRYGFQILAISGVNVFSVRMAEIMLGRISGLGALGLYSRASGLTGMLWDNFHVVVTRVIFVDFAEQKRRGLSLREPYLRIVRTITALLWPAFTGIAVISSPLIATLYGPEWVGAALPLSLLSLASAILVSITMTWEIFVVSGETGRQAWFEFVRAGVGFALFTIGCFFGLEWAAGARVAEAVFAFLLYRKHLERMTEIGFWELAAIYGSSAALTVIAIGPAVLVMSHYGWSAEAPLTAVGGSVLAGMAGWAAALVLSRHPLAAEGELLLRRFAPRRFRRES